MYTVVAVCTVPAIFGTLIALTSLAAANSDAIALDRRSVGPLVALGDLRDMEGDMRVLVWRYLGSGAADRTALAKEIADTDAQADADIQTYLRAHASTTDAPGRLMEQFITDLQGWRAVRDGQVRAAADRGDQIAAYAAVNKELDAANETMAEPLDAVYEKEAATAAIRAKKSVANYHSARLELVAISLMGLVLAVIAGLALTRRMLATVGRVAQVIASGDPDQRVGVTRDTSEIGAVGLALDGMLDAAARQRSDLAAAAQIRDSELSAASVRQRLSEREVRRRSQAFVDEASNAVLTDLHDVLRQADLVRQAANDIEQKAASADSTSKAVVATAEGAERVVTAVAESLGRVEGITNMIAGIAGQTNLLALNATIEAARAGAAGAGFGVVANEVKGLAAATKESTIQISTTVGALQLNAAEMASTITSMSEGIESVNIATGAVTTVANLQRESMERLNVAVNAAVAQMESMSALASQLERRQHDRVSLTGSVQVRFDGRTIDARLHDLSVSGLLCLAGPEAAPLPAERSPVEVVLRLGEERYPLTAVVARRLRGADGEHLGLEFAPLELRVSQAIREFIAGLLNETV